MWRGHLALVPYRWQDASGTQGRDGLATSIAYRESVMPGRFVVASVAVFLYNTAWCLAIGNW
jgi:hypothetical protein